MNKLSLPVLTAGAVFAGFVIGYGIGEKTNTATSKNTDIGYNDGKVNITVDLAASLSDGFWGWVDG